MTFAGDADKPFVDDADNSPCTPRDHDPWYQLKKDWDEVLELVRDVHTQVWLTLLPKMKAVDARTARLEAWVEVVMRTLATLGLETVLTELDEARGADYEPGEITT
jgi:hypothetical protein